MARSPLTLAALATSAVDGLDVAGVQPFGAAGGDFDAALLTGRDGRHWVIRAPRSARAEAEQSADLVALRALSAGVRSRLPFGVSSYAGQVPIGGTRAVVYEFVYGGKATLGGIGPDYAASIGQAIAAIHALPTTFVVDAGLPAQTASESLRATIALVERAAATKLLPAGLHRRWQVATEDARIWQFTPTVINGALAADAFLGAEDQVTGVLGWHALRVGDPAQDLAWLRAGGEDLFESAYAAYAKTRGSTVDRQLGQRALLLGELEVARWLLHGVETQQDDIVEDAVRMMSELIDDVQHDLADPILLETGPVLDVAQVEELLEHTARVR